MRTQMPAKPASLYDWDMATAAAAASRAISSRAPPPVRTPAPTVPKVSSPAPAATQPHTAHCRCIPALKSLCVRWSACSGSFSLYPSRGLSASRVVSRKPRARSCCHRRRCRKTQQLQWRRRPPSRARAREQSRARAPARGRPRRMGAAAPPRGGSAAAWAPSCRRPPRCAPGSAFRDFYCGRKSGIPKRRAGLF